MSRVSELHDLTDSLDQDLWASRLARLNGRSNEMTPLENSIKNCKNRHVRIHK